jgi:hypothetical protein
MLKKPVEKRRRRLVVAPRKSCGGATATQIIVRKKAVIAESAGRYLQLEKFASCSTAVATT